MGEGGTTVPPSCHWAAWERPLLLTGSYQVALSRHSMSTAPDGLECVITVNLMKFSLWTPSPTASEANPKVSTMRVVTSTVGL